MNGNEFEKWWPIGSAGYTPLTPHDAAAKAWQAAEAAMRKPIECGHPRACLVGTLGWPSTGQPKPQECLACEAVKQALKKATDDFDVLRRACEAKAVDAGRLEAAKAMCPYCAGKDDEVDAEPHLIEKQYVPNCGEMDGWIHHQSYGGCRPCHAAAIHRPREAKQK